MADDRERSPPREPAPSRSSPSFAVRVRPKFREVALPQGPAPLDREAEAKRGESG